MAWQQVATNTMGPQAADVIARLSAIDPDYDWTRAIQESAKRLQETYADGGWQDPNRGAAPQISSQIVTLAGQFDPEGARGFQSHVPGLNAAGAARAQAIQQEQSTHGGDGFGSILGIAASIAGMAFGIPPWASAAFKLVLSGGENVLGAALSFMPTFIGGLGEAAGIADAGAENMFGFEGVADAPAAGLLDAGSTLSDTIANTGFQQPTLLANAGTSDVPQGLQGEVSSPDGYEASGVSDAQRFDASRVVDPLAGTGGPVPEVGTTPTGSSWFDKFTNSPTAMATAAVGAGGLIAGALKGMGDRSALREVEANRIKGAQELEAQKARQAEEMLEYKRRFAQSGDFFSARPAVRPGLINNATRV